MAVRNEVMSLNAQADAIVLGNSLCIEIKLGASGDATQIQDFCFRFFGRGAGALFGKRVLHRSARIV